MIAKQLEFLRFWKLGEFLNYIGVPDSVKNGFSSPTKEQVGQDQQGKDVTNDHQGKALKEGCPE